jgi:hypothetical protein
MQLSDLKPKWITEARDDGSARWTKDDENGLSAQAIVFLCRKCFAENHGPVGTHSIIVPFANRGVPDGYMPSMPRWNAVGATFDTLSLTPSILLIGGCGWHGFITNGEVT